MQSYFHGLVCCPCWNDRHHHAHETNHRKISNETLKIVAEFGTREFTVHIDFFNRQSETPIPVRPSSQNESTAPTLDLLEWDGNTVARFVDFLYFGHYQVPSPTQPFKETESVILEDDIYQRDVYTPESVQSNRTETIQSDEAEPAVHPLVPLEEFHEELDTGYNTQKEREAEEKDLELFYPTTCDYEELFLAHAKVYALAQSQGAKILQKLALQRLLTALLTIGSVDPDSPVAINTIDLLRYVYSYPVPLESSKEPMRDMVSHFAALNFPALQSRREMAELMREGGELTSDLMVKVRRRLVNSEDNLRTTRAELIDSEDDLRAARVGPANSEDKLRKMQTELVTTQTKLADSESILRSVRAELADSVDEAHTARADLADSKASLHAARAELSSLKIDLHTTRRELTISESSLRSRLTYSQRNLQAVREELAKVKAARKRFKSWQQNKEYMSRLGLEITLGSYDKAISSVRRAAGLPEEEDNEVIPNTRQAVRLAEEKNDFQIDKLDVLFIALCIAVLSSWLLFSHSNSEL